MFAVSITALCFSKVTQDFILIQSMKFTEKRLTDQMPECLFGVFLQVAPKKIIYYFEITE